ncbi:putative phage abortive infection protein [Bacteroidota bacterium]
MTKNKMTESKWFIPILSLGLIIIISSLWLFSWILIDAFYTNELRGPFGDKFGAINALFTGLAFGFFIIALYMQRKDLQLQREMIDKQQKELHISNKMFEEQKKEFKEHTKQYKESNYNLYVQKFENTLFRLLEFFNDLTINLQTKIEYHINPENKYVDILDSEEIKEVKGKEYFEGIYLYFNYYAQHYKKKILEESMDKGLGVAIGGLYENIFNRHGGGLGIYFRSLYQTLKFVDKFKFRFSKYDEEIIEESEQMKDYLFKKRKFYTNIIRAQLTEYELFVLFLNCLSNRGEKLKIFVENYSLLKHLNLKALQKLLTYDADQKTFELLLSLYDKKAFE